MLGFAMKPNDWTGLINSIETASALWGGMFFPMIPIRKRITGSLKKEISPRFTASNIISGYLDAFDPDIVAKVNGAAVPADLVSNRKQILLSEIFQDFSEDWTPRYGIGITEMLSYFARRELTYVRQQPLRIVFPKLATQYRGFLASVFGLLRPDVGAAVKEVLPENTIEAPECSIENFADFLGPEILFVRRLTTQHLQAKSTTEACLYFLNAANAEDIIDYWNLRAAGWSVLPVPQQAFETASIKQLVTKFVNENYWSYRHNPNFFHHTNVIKARNASAPDLVKFINSLSLEPPKAEHSPRITIIPSYPRIWDEWARDKDQVDVQRISSSRSEIDISDDVPRLNFSPIAPKFLGRFGGHGTPRFANDIEIRFYGGSEPYAEVIPAGDDRLVRAIGTYGFEEWRFSRHGISHLCRHPEFTVRLAPPRADRVFTEWLRCNGWDVELSDKGYIATQMLKRLGGVWDSTILASRGLIGLLRRMTTVHAVPDTKVVGIKPTESTEPAAKILKAKTFNAEISKFCAAEGVRESDQYLRRLLELQIFRLGLEVQCPTCRQRWWESLKALDYDLNCPNCFETFSVSSWLPKDFEWAFRTAGPFSLPGSAFGVYAVLLTLRFFSMLLHGASTPLLSFKLRKGASEVEVDLGLLFDLREHGKDRREIVFAECKSYNEFTRVDVQRLESLGRNFPGAVLVIAVLRDNLSTREQNLLRPFVNRSRRYWKGERPVHPVLILTGNELFASDAPPRCWEKLGAKYATFKERYELAYNLADLADATQRIYLGLPPWHQWLASKRPAPPAPPPRSPDGPVDESLIIKTPVSVALRRVEFGD